MNIKITSLYNNEKRADTQFIAHHGQSFLITIGEEKIIFDLGDKIDILLHNMRLLKLAPDDITKIVLSHGHIDHSGGLPGFLDSRKQKKPIEMFAHPDYEEEKLFKVFVFKKNLGCPRLTDGQKKKLIPKISKSSQKVAPCLKTTGEVICRKEKDGVEKSVYHWDKGQLVVDPIMDDLSLVLSVKGGVVIIAGCAHSGLLNICQHVKTMTNKKIVAVIGGIHMARHSEEEVLYVADKLEQLYASPTLYLNHCTDKLPVSFIKATPTIEILKNRFGQSKVRNLYIGETLEFEGDENRI